MSPKQIFPSSFVHVIYQGRCIAALISVSASLSFSLPGDDNAFHTVLFWMIRKLQAEPIVGAHTVLRKRRGRRQAAGISCSLCVCAREPINCGEMSACLLDSINIKSIFFSFPQTFLSAAHTHQIYRERQSAPSSRLDFNTVTICSRLLMQRGKTCWLLLILGSSSSLSVFEDQLIHLLNVYEITACISFTSFNLGCINYLCNIYFLEIFYYLLFFLFINLLGKI